MKLHKYFVSGIDTDIGKTIVSSILVEALCADYWKPVQSGLEGLTDSITVKSLISNEISYFHDETYMFREPASPHYSAALENTTINEDAFILPQTQKNLIVEGAGGLFVPLNDHFLIIDLIKKLNIPVIIVSKNYLGSINHTLMSIDTLIKRDIEIAGIVFNGTENLSSQEFILQYSGIKCIGKIPFINLDKEAIKQEADKIRMNFI